MDQVVILLERYTPLLHKTLHQASLFQSHRQYEDYLQELRLKLLDIAGRFDGAPLSEQDGLRFTAYVKRALYWHLLNLLKADKIYREQPTETLLYDDQGQMVVADLAQQLALQAFYREAHHLLTSQEWQVFTALAQADQDVKSLAQAQGRTVQAIYKCKRKIAHKLRQLREDLLSH